MQPTKNGMTKKSPLAVTRFMAVPIALVLVCLCMPSEAQQVNQHQSGAEIMSPQKDIRVKSTQEVLRQYGDIKNSLLDNLKSLGPNPSKAFDSPFHLTIIVIEKIRMEEAVDVLTPMLSFRLDPATAPAGGFNGPQSYYPVANALAAIGGKHVTGNILRRLVLPTDDETLQLSGWVLKESLGTEVAALLVQQRLNEITALLKKIGKSDTNPEKENLEKIEKLLVDGGPILPDVSQNQTNK